MIVTAYKKLALDWHPEDVDDRSFYLITIIVLFLSCAFAISISLIEVPPQERRERAVVPDRIAKFISQKEKLPAPQPLVRPKPAPKLVPKVEPKPVIERKRPSEVEKKPLTETQKKARESAEQSGLLALSNELVDLMDTSEVSSMVAGNLSKDPAGTQVISGHDSRVITAGVAQGGGGVDSGRYGSGISATELAARDVARVESELFAGDANAAKKAGAGKVQARSPNGRSEEDVTIVFDRNKGSLYSLYERERRKTPGLQGKIVLQITIAPDGRVTQVRIISSELNSPALEARLISRIKQFKFEPGTQDTVTVTYPIEFLPT